VCLPIAGDELPEAAAPPAAELEEAFAGETEGRRILVVEDNPDAAATLRDFLELSGHEVALASSGSDGVQAARRFHPEVVLCDLGLPGMNGFEVAAALRRDPVTASARLIAITGYGGDEDRRRSARAGFDLHLTKPVDPGQLRRALAVR
jgi:CheY-like chemotaxis protein